MSLEVGASHAEFGPLGLARVSWVLGCGRALGSHARYRLLGVFRVWGMASAAI